MKNYDKHGHEGFTTTMGGRRIAKDDIIIQVSGLIDSLQSSLDFVHSTITHPADKELIANIQNKLWQMAAEISMGKVDEKIKDPIIESDVKFVENKIVNIGKPPTKFARFTTSISLYLNETRIRTRTLESALTPLLRQNLIRPIVYSYVNRLSDLFFMMAYILEEEKVHHEIKKEKGIELKD